MFMSVPYADIVFVHLSLLLDQPNCVAKVISVRTEKKVMLHYCGYKKSEFDILNEMC